MSTPRSRPATYELTIAGTLGPVLRGALAPCTATSSEPQTIIRADVGDGSDLVDLVLLLDARGLEVTGIVELD